MRYTLNAHGIPGGHVTLHGSTQVEIISAETSIVTLHGEHDLGSAAQLTVALAVAARCPNILVDVSDSEFIDSSVISAFLRAARKARQRDGALELVVPGGGFARRTLDLAGVASLLAFHDSRREASRAPRRTHGSAAGDPAFARSRPRSRTSRRRPSRSGRRSPPTVPE